MYGNETSDVRLRAQIADAQRLVLVAEADLDEAVAQLRPVQIGDKRLTTESLDRSFHKLVAARALVVQLSQALEASERADASH